MGYWSDIDVLMQERERAALAPAPIPDCLILGPVEFPPGRIGDILRGFAATITTTYYVLPWWQESYDPFEPILISLA